MNEFDKRYHKTKSHGTTMSDDILAYRLLKAANLTPQHEELIKATITDLKFDSMKEQLKKTFSDSTLTPTAGSEDIIKIENTLFTEGFVQDYQDYNEDGQQYKYEEPQCSHNNYDNLEYMSSNYPFRGDNADKLQLESFYNNNTFPLVCRTAIESIDIDTKEDWKIAKKLVIFKFN